MNNASHNLSLSHLRKVLLYADDDDDDCFLVLNMTRKISGQLDVRVVRDGQHAVEWLSGMGVYADRNAYPMPDMLLLDLKMPRVNGFDLMRWVRNQPEFAKLSLVVYSNSSVDNIDKICKDLGAMKFIGKDVRCNALKEFLQVFVAHESHPFGPSPTIGSSPTLLQE